MMSSPATAAPLPAIPDFLASDASSFSPISAADSKPSERPRGAHVMFYSKAEGQQGLPSWWRASKGAGARVLMTLRDDGSLGFPGGLADDAEEAAEAAATREAKEEVGVDGDEYKISPSDFLCCHVHSHPNVSGQNKEVELHFFAKELTADAFRHLEKKAADAEYHGTEILGAVRVPIATFKPEYDAGGKKGLPTFLRNVFAGNARVQLLYGLYARGIMDLEDIRKAMEASGQANYEM